MKITLEKIIILFVGLCLTAGELLQYFEVPSLTNISHTITLIGRIGGPVLIFGKGVFTADKLFFRLLTFCLIYTAIGGVMKIMHWPFANLILLTGLAAIPVIYGLYFFKKQHKQRLDVLKLIWIAIFCTTIILFVLHNPFRYVLQSLSWFILMVMYIYFAIGKLRENENSELEE